MVNECSKPQESYDQWLPACEPVENFLEFKNSTNHVEMSSSFKPKTIVSIEVSEGDEGNGSDFTSASQYFVPLSLIKRWGAAMGILVFFLLIADRIRKKSYCLNTHGSL